MDTYISNTEYLKILIYNGVIDNKGERVQITDSDDVLRYLDKLSIVNNNQRGLNFDQYLAFFDHNYLNNLILNNLTKELELSLKEGNRYLYNYTIDGFRNESIRLELLNDKLVESKNNHTTIETLDIDKAIEILNGLFREDVLNSIQLIPMNHGSKVIEFKSTYNAKSNKKN